MSSRQCFITLSLILLLQGKHNFVLDQSWPVERERAAAAFLRGEGGKYVCAQHPYFCLTPVNQQRDVCFLFALSFCIIIYSMFAITTLPYLFSHVAQVDALDDDVMLESFVFTS